MRVRSERSQAQQETAQLQLQLQELADKANSKLYDYRLKLKGAKKRSQLRCVDSTSRRTVQRTLWRSC